MIIVFVRTKRKGGGVYYYLVESKREGKKVRQKIIKYLGAEPPTKEQIESMIRRIKDERQRSEVTQ